MASAVETSTPNPSAVQPNPKTEPDSLVYTSLIQTYINLLSYDNATFLAERYAAACPADENAIYLLAYCYYRRGNAKAARSVLLKRWMGRNVAESKGDVELARIRSSARYLLATCCYDLGLYGEAEEALLRHVRGRFEREVVNKSKVRGNVNDVMDAWILQTDVSS
jgi:DNA-binding SARP family transcriptional activator